jgi:RsiW-degrading membrane proteinase PrsW (M82 family)
VAGRILAFVRARATSLANVLLTAIAIASLLSLPGSDVGLLVFAFLLLLGTALVGLYLFRSTERSHREPMGHLIRTMLLGVLLGDVTYQLVITVAQLPSIVLLVVVPFVVIPVVEVLKLVPVISFGWRQREFDRPIDGVYYAGAAAAGYAIIISLFLELSVGSGGIVGFGSLLFTLPIEMAYSAVAGFYVGLAKFQPDARWPIMTKGVLVSSLIHGGSALLAALLLLPFHAVGLLVVFPPLAGVFGFPLAVAIVRRRSRHFYRGWYELLARRAPARCATCASPLVPGANFCSMCGARVVPGPVPGVPT